MSLEFWFLIRGSVRFKIGWLLILGALYNWHNTLRHRPGIRLTNKGFWREVRRLAAKRKPQWVDLTIMYRQGFLY